MLPKSFVIEPEFNDLAKAKQVHELCKLIPIPSRLYPTFRLTVLDFQACGVTRGRRQASGAAASRSRVANSNNDNREEEEGEGGDGDDDEKEEREGGYELGRHRHDEHDAAVGLGHQQFGAQSERAAGRGRRKTTAAKRQRRSHLLDALAGADRWNDDEFGTNSPELMSEPDGDEYLLLNIRFPVIKALRTNEDTYATLVCAVPAAGGIGGARDGRESGQLGGADRRRLSGQQANWNLHEAEIQDESRQRTRVVKSEQHELGQASDSPTVADYRALPAREFFAAPVISLTVGQGENGAASTVRGGDILNVSDDDRKRKLSTTKAGESRKQLAGVGPNNYTSLNNKLATAALGLDFPAAPPSQLQQQQQQLMNGSKHVTESGAACANGRAPCELSAPVARRAQRPPSSELQQTTTTGSSVTLVGGARWPGADELAPQASTSVVAASLGQQSAGGGGGGRVDAQSGADKLSHHHHAKHRLFLTSSHDKNKSNSSSSPTTPLLDDAFASLLGPAHWANDSSENHHPSILPLAERANHLQSFWLASACSLLMIFLVFALVVGLNLISTQ